MTIVTSIAIILAVLCAGTLGWAVIVSKYSAHRIKEFNDETDTLKHRIRSNDSFYVYLILKREKLHIS